MDLATIIGILVAFGLVIMALGRDALMFVDLPSLLIVVGGSVGALLVTYPLKSVLGVLGIIQKTFLSKEEHPGEVVTRFVDYATQVRREGVLSLEPQLENITDDFLRKGLQLAVDGLDPQLIEGILETELSYQEDRHLKGADVLQTLGTISPAMGMIGTVIGLILMLKQLNDPSTIGPAMAVALITTFYGAIMANLIFLPMAGKLRVRSREEMLIRAMTVEGIMCISRGENPRIIEEKLNSFLSPKDRKVQP